MRHCFTLLEIYFRERELPIGELHVINYQTAILHVKYLHSRTKLVDENERVPILDVHPHLVGDNTT